MWEAQDQKESGRPSQQRTREGGGDRESPSEIQKSSTGQLSQ